MKVFILASLLVVAVSASLLEEQGFQAFKLKHGKTYRNQAEEIKRFNIFKENVHSIEEHNDLYEQGLSSYKQATNQFTDMTHEEFKSMLRLSVSQRPHFNATAYKMTGLAAPNSIDWRNQGYVSEVKNQGDCGSCWSFSVTGSTEGAYKRKTGNLVSLSEQQLVDCSRNINGGCNGGYLDLTFPYIQQYGLESENSYPYTSSDYQSCQYNAGNVVTRISGFTALQNKNEWALVDAVGNIGPVSVAVDASYLGFYGSGIYQDNRCSLSELNHAVLVVGYGSENGVNYWIVKNSWSSDFGEQGYFRIVRGQNQCGIAEDMMITVAYPGTIVFSAVAHTFLRTGS